VEIGRNSRGFTVLVAVLMLWRWLRRERLGLTRRPPSEGEAGAVEVGAGKPQAAVA